MVIFAFGILAVVNMQLLSSWTNTKSRNMTQGIAVAQGKIEELSSVDYSSLVDVNNDDTTDKSIAIDPSLNDFGTNADYLDPANAGAFYKTYWNVRENYPYDDTKTIRVIVRWDEKGLPKSFSLDMIKAFGD